MTRRVTTTRRSDAHDPTKALLKAASTPTRGRHQSALQAPEHTELVPGSPPLPRVRKPRPVTPKM